ncbi:unnamed protein product [Diamesa hyperborea]
MDAGNMESFQQLNDPYIATCDSEDFSLMKINTNELIGQAGDNVFIDYLNLNGSEDINKIYGFNDHLNKLPMLDEVHTPWTFDVQLHSENSGKSSYMYSSKLNKVFVKLGSAMNVYVSYATIDSNTEVFVRAMIVYSNHDDLNEPVKKCPNHKEQSLGCLPEIIPHILKCAVPETEYKGVENGVKFNERIAIVVPMKSLAENEPLKLEFTCQNSCSGGMNRKMTSIVFTLEDQWQRILGRKLMNFKVCSCPKRDKEKEEGSVPKNLPKKRKADSVPSTSSKKISYTSFIPVVKTEDTTLSASDSDNNLLAIDTTELLNAVKEEECILNIALPSEKIKKDLLQLAYNAIAGQMTMTFDNSLNVYLDDIKRQIGMIF